MAVLRLVPSQGSPDPIEVSRERMIVGREPTCDVVVSDGSVSRKHAILEQRGNGWAVVDQGSANGTFVDSQRVTEMALATGQELRFGSMAYRVEIEGDDESATILTSSPDATILQDAVKPKAPGGPPAPPPAPAVKPAPPPWSAPPGAPRVTSAAPLPKDPASPAPAAPAPPPLPPRPAAAPPLPPRATPAASAPPPLPPRPATARPVVTPVTDGAPPPAKKKRGPLFWAGGGCCGCLVLILVFFGVIGGGAYFMTSGAVEAVRAQIADVKKGDMAAAYGRMSDEYRSQHTMEDFVAFVDRHPALKQNTDSTFTSRSVKNDTASLSGNLSGANAVKEDVAYTLVKENGNWKISSIAFGEDTGVPSGGTSSSAPDGAPAAAAAAATGAGNGGSLRLQTLSADKTEAPPGHVVAIKLRATGFGTTGPPDAPRADLVLDLETLGPGGARLPDLSRMELQSRDHPDSLSPPSADFDVSVTLRDAAPGNYVARLTVRDQIGRDIKTQAVPFSLP